MQQASIGFLAGIALTAAAFLLFGASDDPAVPEALPPGAGVDPVREVEPGMAARVGTR